MTETLPPLFLAGPTAAGKSALALRLAEELGGEIVSVDSMQIWRGLDIGTAKPSLRQRDAVPHHLIDVVDLHQTFDAQKFVEEAEDAVRKIRGRRRRPVFCGGTGFWFKAYREGLDALPPRQPALRRELEQLPTEQLWEELRDADPPLFARIDRHNLRRVIRALEIIRLTGKPASQQRRKWTAPTVELPLIVLYRAAASLRERIDRRVDAMFRQGLIEETRSLMAKGLANHPAASRALGYRQVIEHLNNPGPLAETVTSIKTKTWQFARRQLTWYRKQPGTVWLDLDRLTLAQQCSAVSEACSGYRKTGVASRPPSPAV